MSHLSFWILAFSTNFCPIKVTLFDRKLQVFKKSPNWPFLEFLTKLKMQTKLASLAMLNDTVFVIFKHRGLQFINYGWEGVQEVILLFKMCSTGCEKKNGRNVFLDEKLAFALISLR